MPDKVTITDAGVKLAVLEGVRAEDQRTLARLIEHRGSGEAYDKKIREIGK